MKDITKEYGYPWYPRHVKDSEGRVIEAKDHIHHGKIIGKKVSYNAVVMQAPTLEQVIAAGYSQERAEQIVAGEQEKEAKEYKPYGDIEPPAPLDPPQAAESTVDKPTDPEPTQESTVDKIEEQIPDKPATRKKAAPQPDNWE